MNYMFRYFAITLMMLCGSANAADWSLEIIFPDDEVKTYLLNEKVKIIENPGIDGSCSISPQLEGNEPKGTGGLSKVFTRSITCSESKKKNPDEFASIVICRPGEGGSGGVHVKKKGKIYRLILTCKK